MAYHGIEMSPLALEIRIKGCQIVLLDDKETLSIW